MLSLSNPQDIFLNRLNTKYRAYVGGFGCVSPYTRIWTEHGLLPICEINRPMRVLSYDEKSGQCQLSLTGGAFPKGRANLYRVSTQRGEFVASEHHHSLCADGKYRRVDSLRAGHDLSSFDQHRLLTMTASDLLSLPSSAQHYSQKHADLMGSYADAARQYGRRLLRLLERAPEFSPLQVDAPLSCRLSGHRDHQASAQWRTRQGQLFSRKPIAHFLGLVARRVFSLADQRRALPVEHTSHYRQPITRRLLMSASHRIKSLFSSVYRSQYNSLFKTTNRIIAVNRDDKQEEYWDMQVLETNNYVTEDGTIHHNSGKTFIGCLDLLIFASKNPKTRQGYFGPTYPAIRDIFYPTFEEAAELMGFRVVIRTTDKEVDIYRGRLYYGTVICRSMDNPASIVGFKIARALVDEIDVLKRDKAKDAWNKIVARMRLVVKGEINSIGVTTTPEGFKWTYEQFANDPTPSYSMVQASTYENADYLPPDYIDTLIETYPSNLISAYLSGKFVNLTSGTVYRSYDRIAHRSTETHKQGEPVFVGMDFNIDKMAATVYVLRGQAYHAVDQIKDGYNTPAVAEIIKERYAGCDITIYPDSSGKNRTRMGGAAESDIAILTEEYKFRCRYKPTNPAVKDRIAATNAAFEHGRLFVNDAKCPDVAACFEQQTYAENGEPDKTAGKDHQNDASTYPIAYELPIIKPIANVNVSFAL